MPWTFLRERLSTSEKIYKNSLFEWVENLPPIQTETCRGRSALGSWNVCSLIADSDSFATTMGAATCFFI